MCRGGGARRAVRLRGARPRRRRGAGRGAATTTWPPGSTSTSPPTRTARSTSPRTSPGTSREGEERHGIERFVTVRVGYQDRADTYREYPLSDVTATSPSGAPADVSVSDAADGSSVRIRVGRADETVSGTQTYVVRYHLGAYVNGFTDHAEVYYNLVDAADDNVYEDVSATVTGPRSERPRRVLHRRVRVDRALHGHAGRERPVQRPEGGQRAGGLDPGLAADRRVRLARPGAARGPGVRRRRASSRSTTSKALGALALGAGVTLPLLAAGLMGTLVYTRGRDEQYAGLTPGLRPGRGRAGPGRPGAPRPGRGPVHPAGGRPAGARRHGHRRDGQHHRRLRHHHRPRRPRPPHHRRGGRRVPAGQGLAAHPHHPHRRAGPHGAAALRGGPARRDLRERRRPRTLSSLKNHFKPTLEPGPAADVRRGRAARLVPPLPGGAARHAGPGWARCWSSARSSRSSGSAARCRELGAGTGLPVPPAFVLLGGLRARRVIVGAPRPPDGRPHRRGQRGHSPSPRGSSSTS